MDLSSDQQNMEKKENVTEELFSVLSALNGSKDTSNNTCPTATGECRNQKPVTSDTLYTNPRKMQGAKPKHLGNRSRSARKIPDKVVDPSQFGFQHAKPSFGRMQSSGRTAHKSFDRHHKTACENEAAMKSERINSTDRLRSDDIGIKTSAVNTRDGNKHKFSNLDLQEERAYDKKPRGIRGTGYKFMEKLLSENTEDIVIKLANSHSGFDEMLKTEMFPELIFLILNVLRKVCEAGFQHNKTSILMTSCQQNFLDQLTKHLMLLAAEEKQSRKDKILEFLDNLLTFYETVINLLPNTACEKFRKMFIITGTAISGVQTYQSLNCDKIKKRFEDLEVQLKNMIEEREKSLAKENSRNEQLKYMLPPDNFRTIEIYPTAEDFSNYPFLRPSIVKGSYLDVDHYLDVQFRLLREDFIGPLRDGISQYVESSLQKNKKLNRVEHVRVYHDVSFKNTVTVKDKVGLLLNFDPHKRFKDVNWEHSKRFMYGSLLCFTSDNFGSFFFGTVLERDKKYITEGLIVVEIHNEVERKLFDSLFTMVESEVYFEPYNQVLNALQSLPSGQFPMKPYIIDGMTEVGAPLYLLANEDVSYYIDDRIVTVLGKELWPSAEDFELDTSQYKAFKSALTKEFVIIQGPPGTGKTFLGLKIAETLLENAQIWNVNKRPILVVCYTNHALDQFLEGILKRCTKDIIRVGGQSQCESLEQYNLREVRRTYVGRRIASALSRDIFVKMQNIMGNIQSLQADLQQIVDSQGVISIHCLSNVADNEQQIASFSSNNHTLNSAKFLEWLSDNVDCDGDFENIEIMPQESKLVITDDGADSDDDLEDPRKVAYRDEYEFEINVESSRSLRFDLDLTSLANEIHRTKVAITTCEDSEMYQQLNQKYYHLQLEYRFWMQRLSRPSVPDGRTVERLCRTRNLWDLSIDDRWTLYWHWVHRLHCCLMQRTWNLQAEYQRVCKQYDEVRNMEDLDIMKGALVIGMTTTGAARLQPLLQELKPRIVIVEEAAEVLESHIVVSLTKDCEHLILIGDHKQLRPSTAVFNLARKYNFDISLFERMLQNGMNCDCLEVQHRMRQEIAALITPTIYPKLLNHPSVLYYHNVRGVTKNMFFVNHGYHEEEVSETVSHRNIHEADFLLALCRYLLLQGYEAHEITILTTYSGQMYYMRKERKNSSQLENVKITVVDKFQGEENKIILLSLVRSNNEAKIGFLKVENRVCVALSRAKEGFFIIGNMDNLVQSSKIWPQIKETLEKQDSFGTHLTLKCQIHPTEETRVASASDFKAVPEGGCGLPCNTQLPCGHLCQSVCHVKDRFHEGVKCYFPCERIPKQCKLGHTCLKKCYEDCAKCETPMEKELPCGHTKTLPCHKDVREYQCQEQFEVVLEACSHRNMKFCFQSLENVRCTFPCDDRLQCGHSCVMRCHSTRDPDHLEYKCYKPCERKNSGCTRNHKCNKRCYEDCGECIMEIKVELPNCGHTHQVQCSTDLSTIKCKRDCKRIMSCGHICRLYCFQPCGNCQVKVEKTIPECLHKVNVPCSKSPTREMCRKTCERMLLCGHRCQNMCCNPCTSECQELVPSKVRPACGHAVEIPCYLQHQDLSPLNDDLLRRCQMPCGQLLNCGHPCRGTCGKCWQGRLHEPCKEKCGRVLICGHSCNVECGKNCPPCKQKCQYRCKHSRCRRDCGVPCVPCKEPCESRCNHSRCSKLCYEICNRERCNEPCRKMLKCGHHCVGFCGEPCPPLCRKCNKEELTEVFLGFEDDDDARFVYLEDCKHTIESKGLEMWMENTDGEIQLKTCPRCKTQIKHTLRFMNQVKVVYKDVHLIKKKIFGNSNTIGNKRMEALSGIDKIIFPALFKKESAEAQRFINMLKENLSPITKGRRNFLSLKDVDSLSIKVEILSQLAKSVNLFAEKLDSEGIKKLASKFDLLLKMILIRNSQMSDQEVSDFNLELVRFSRFASLCSLESNSEFKMSKHQTKVADLYNQVWQSINTIERFTEQHDKVTKSLIADLSKQLRILAVPTEEERKQIVKAIGLLPGHWFKCPNGHYYAIGECGGAMQQSKCIECGARIGGSDHRLLSDNRHAPEIDGSRAPSWPQ